MATKLGIYNSALNLLGQRPLATLAENRESRRVLDTEYDRVVKKCLHGAVWAFAMRTAAATPKALPTIDKGYTNAYNLPSDLIYTYLASKDNDFRDFIQPSAMEQTRAEYLTGTSALFIQYTSNDANFGMQIANWPPFFEQYVITDLATQTCFQLTRDSERMLRLRQMAELDLSAARSIEAMIAAPGVLPMNDTLRREFQKAGNVEQPMPFVEQVTATQKR